MADDQIAIALRLVLQAGREMQASMAHRLDLRVTDVQAIDHVVTATHPLGPGELGERLGIRSASASVLVDRLVAAGHLAREPDPHDGRRTSLVATDRARREIRRALAPLIAEIATITDRLDAEQAATVLQFLRDAASAMRNDGGDTGSKARRRPPG